MRQRSAIGQHQSRAECAAHGSVGKRILRSTRREPTNLSRLLPGREPQGYWEMLQHVGPKRLIEPEKLKSHSKVPLRWEEIPVLIPFGRWVETGKFVRLVTPEILEE